MKYEDIASFLKIKSSRLRMLIKKFKDNDYAFIENEPKKSKITNELKEFLLKQETLVKWQTYSLRERCR
jgi:hypothetical protein